MKKKLALLAVCAQLCAAASTPAHAAAPTASRDGIRSTGVARNLDVVRGSARDMPLAQAINAIVPRDFSVRTVGVARRLLDEPVSWSGGRPWTEVLLDLLDLYPELAVDVSLGARIVIVRQLPAAQAADVREERYEPAAPAAQRQARTASFETLRGAAPALPMANLAQRAAAPALPMANPAPSQPPAASPSHDVALAAMQALIQSAAQAAVQGALQGAAQSAKQVAVREAAPAPAPVPAPPVVAQVEPPPVPTWEIAARDRTIRSALERWTASAGWQLSWELAVDYPVAARTTISGNFETAVEAVAHGLERAEVPIKAVFYRGNRVLRIIPKGAQ